MREQVTSGRFNNASEVIRAALRLLEDHQTKAAMKADTLRAAIASGMTNGPGISTDEVFDRLEVKYRTMDAE